MPKNFGQKDGLTQMGFSFPRALLSSLLFRWAASSAFSPKLFKKCYFSNAVCFIWSSKVLEFEKIVCIRRHRNSAYKIKYHYLVIIVNGQRLKIKAIICSLWLVWVMQAGPRICLGREFAYRQMKIFAATLLYFFKFKMWDEKKEVSYRTMLTLQIDGGLHLGAFRRWRCFNLIYSHSIVTCALINMHVKKKKKKKTLIFKTSLWLCQICVVHWYHVKPCIWE